MSVALRINKEIEFQVPRDADQVVSGFKIENTSKDVVAYKVKTTAPKRYSVRPNTGIVTPGDSVQVKVTLNWAKEPKRDSEPDKFQILSVLVNISGDKKPPKPDDDAYSDYIRRLWKAATPDKIFKDRLKITIKKDPNARDTGSARISGLSLGNNLSFSGERNRDDNRLSLDRRRDSYRMEGGTSLSNSMDPRNSRSLDRLKTSTNTSERPRESSRAQSDRGRESSRTPPERPRDSSRAPSERPRDSSRAPSERPRESSRAPSDRGRDNSRAPLDRSERGASRSMREFSRSRESSIGPPQDRERSRSRSAYFDGYYSERERSRTRDRSVPPSRESSRVRSYEREDRGRSGYDYERSRSRSTSRMRERSPDEGYRSSREVSRSRSSSRIRDERSRSRTRDDYDEYYYGYDRKQDFMMRPPPRPEERPQVRREIDSLFRKYEDLNSKTAQKTQERQLLFIALAFFIGFIFAQAFFY